jgi:outer membrane protein TolC
VILLLISSALAGQPLSLEYQATLEQALRRNPSLVGGAHDVTAASGALLAAKGAFDPALRGGTSKSHSTSESIREFGEVLSDFEAFSWNAGVDQVLPTGTTLGLDWSQTQTRFRYELRDTGFVIEQDEPLFQTRMVGTISQSLLDGFALSSNLQGVRQASARLSIAEADLAAQRQQTLADVATAYWNLRTTQRLAQIAEHALQTAQEEQRVVHLKVEQGTLAPVEMARVDAAVIQSESALLEASNTAHQAADMLLLLIGESPGSEVVLTTEPADVQPLSLDAQALVETALSKNPALTAARARSSAAELWALDARRRRLPQLDANASYGLVGYEPSAAKSNTELMSGDLPDWTVGATVRIPLLNRADRGAYLERTAQAARSRVDHEALARSIDQQVRTQVRTLTAAHTQVRLARANLALAQQTLGAERALREAGRAIQKDVLEAMSTSNNAEVAVERALADYQLALIELERLKGTL